MEETIMTKADVLAETARSVRAHYGDRLEALYVLPHGPYENGIKSDIHLVLVLQAPFDAFGEANPLSRIIDALNRRYAGEYVVFQHIADEDLAERARKEGIAL